MAARTGLSRGAEVGEATVTGDDVDLSFATDLASVGAPARDLLGDLVSTEEDAGDNSPPGGIGRLVGHSRRGEGRSRDSCPHRASPWPSGGAGPRHSGAEDVFMLTINRAVADLDGALGGDPFPGRRRMCRRSAEQWQAVG
jgi:hypothetical protein